MNIQKTRIYEKNVALKYDDVKIFFEQRGNKAEELPLLNLTMYQDENPELAIQRDLYEKEFVSKLLNLNGKNYNILDIGCGIGRWGFHLATYAKSYLGFDYNEKFIELARQNAIEHNLALLNFQVLSAIEFDIEDLSISPPFDLIIIAGVLAYINDEDCNNLFTKICKLVAANGIIYLREPIGISKRLTLQKHYSEDLKTHYNAIYRTNEEYQEMFKNTIYQCGLQNIYNGDLYPEDLNNRKDTKQHIYIFKKNE